MNIYKKDMQKVNSNSVLGILGGIGPLASSKFVQSIYFSHAHRFMGEQALPKVILYSDPSMPDRTEYLDLGLHDVLLTHLIKGLDKLLNLGANKLVICCFTLHHLLSSLPQAILEHIISLPELALDKVIALQKKSLILCTSATSRLRIFESAPNWNEAAEFVIFPDTYDQKMIHEAIYKLKKNTGYAHSSEYIKWLLEKYQADCWVVGCTEFHLMSHHFLIDSMQSHEDEMSNVELLKKGSYVSTIDKTTSIIDPLLIISELVNEGFFGEEKCLKKVNQAFSKTT